GLQAARRRALPLGQPQLRDLPLILSAPHARWPGSPGGSRAILVVRGWRGASGCGRSGPPAGTVVRRGRPPRRPPPRAAVPAGADALGRRRRAATPEGDGPSCDVAQRLSASAGSLGLGRLGGLVRGGVGLLGRSLLL